MQASSPVSTRLLSSSNPVNGNLKNQCPPQNASEPRGQGAHPPPSPPPKPSARNTKRHVDTTLKTQKAVQAAKQELRSKLREDWTWPPEPDSCLHLALNVPEDESAWQERGDGFDTDSSLGESIVMDPYQYEDADAVRAPTVTVSFTDSKKRKRKQMLSEEMEWNQGLRHFVERRDAWSGAREIYRGPLATAKEKTARAGGHSHATNERDVSVERNATSVATKNFKAEPIARPSVHMSLAEQSISMTLVPFAPPILPHDNAVRASITPATYCSIYSKIVVQGLTPTIPINLHDVVGALVKGWKDCDEWPPKSEAERTTFMQGTKGCEGAGDSINNVIKGGVRRRMGKVKRALHLSGAGYGHEDVGRGSGKQEAPNIINSFE